MPRFARALRHRNYRLFLTGQIISTIGTWMQSIAESWLVYRLTGSALLLGAAGFANQIPVFLVAPLGGIVAAPVFGKLAPKILAYLNVKPATQPRSN